MKKYIYYILLSLGLSATVNAQTLFQKTYGGTMDDKGFSGFQTPDGGYIFCGNTSTTGRRYFYLVKTNSMGDTTWTKRYKSDNDNIAYRIRPTKDTCYIITGYSGAWASVYTQDVFLLKVKTNGDSLWGKTYGTFGTYSEEGYDVIQTKDLGYIITGKYGTSSGFSYIYVLKTNAIGTQQWYKSYNVSLASSGKSITETLDGYYTLTGLAYNSSYTHIGLLKIDTTLGTQLWFKYIQVGSLGQEAAQVVQNADSTYTILSSVNVDPGTGFSDMGVVKCNSSGDTLWSKVFASGRCQSIDTVQGGGYVVSGFSGGSNPKAMLVRLNSNFDTLWAKTYPPLSSYLTSNIYEAHQTSDKGFIMIGYCGGFGPTDALLIKTDSVGNITTLITGINENGVKNQTTVYPNPFNDYSTVTIVEAKNVQIKIIDMSGSVVQNFRASGKEFNIKVVGLKSGSYTLMILNTDDNNSLIAVKKIIIER